MNDPAKKDRTWLYVGAGFVIFWGLYLAFLGPKGPSDAPRRQRSEGTGGMGKGVTARHDSSDELPARTADGAVERALAVLCCFSRETPTLGVTTHWCGSTHRR